MHFLNDCQGFYTKIHANSWKQYISVQLNLRQFPRSAATVSGNIAALTKTHHSKPLDIGTGQQTQVVVEDATQMKFCGLLWQ